MLKHVSATIAVSIGIAAAVAAPSQAMSISSAARSISTSLPVRNVELSEQVPFSNRHFCLQHGRECHDWSRNAAVDIGALPR